MSCQAIPLRRSQGNGRFVWVTADFSHQPFDILHSTFRIFRGQVGWVMDITRSSMTWCASQTASNQFEAVMTTPGTSHPCMRANSQCGKASCEWMRQGA